MAEQFQGTQLRELASAAEEAEAAASRMESSAATARVADANLCEIYRGTIRGPLDIVRRIVCNPFVKGVIGPAPCRILTTTIEILDGICPAG